MKMSVKVVQFLILISIINHGRSDLASDIAGIKKEMNYQLGLMKDKLNLIDTELVQMNKTIESKINTNNETTCEKDWISYSDTKCYKSLGKKGSELEAKGNCSQLESSSTLITIESKEEQLFLSNHLKVYKNVSDFVWIGLEFVDKAFKWMDGKALKYENWGENAIKDGNSKCVQMSLADSDLGKWADDLCQKKYQIICQKKQATKTVIGDDLKKLTKIVDKQEINLENNKAQIENLVKENKKLSDSLIPLSFLYTQLPNQSSPQQLWPNMEWTEVTKQYAGLFFRAEGGGSDTFGNVQAANHSRLSDIIQIGNNIAVSGKDTKSYQHSIKEGEWSEELVSEPATVLDDLKIYMTSGENRPRNTAIKIYKRIK